MKNWHITLTAILALLLIPATALAQQNGQETPNQAQVENQAQTQTNNPEIGTMTQTQTQEGLNQQIQESKPEYSPKSDTAKQHMNAVTTSVENLVRFSNQVENQGVAGQIREVAGLQGESEDKANRSLDAVQSRNSFMKFLIGPNYNELEKVREEINQNQLRIQKLQRIVTQIQNAGDKTTLQNEIKVLAQQNTSLQNQLDDTAGGFSLLGWLFRFFSGY